MPIGYYGPGEGWIDALYGSFTWMQVRPQRIREQPVPTADPQAEIPGAVGTPEACFRMPDGWIKCVFRDSIWAQQYRNQGLPEVAASAPEFLPEVATQTDWTFPQVVVPSDASEEIPGDQVPLHGEGGWIDGLIGAYDTINQWGNTPIYNFGGPGAAGPAATVGPTTMTPNGTCGQSPCVCGVDSCGRPALIDPRTGKRCYRRRRRRLLTEGDFNDLMRIATLPNKQNVTVALAKAIGRR